MCLPGRGWYLPAWHDRQVGASPGKGFAPVVILPAAQISPARSFDPCALPVLGAALDTQRHAPGARVVNPRAHL